MLFSQIMPPLAPPTESKSLFFIAGSLYFMKTSGFPLGL